MSLYVVTKITNHFILYESKNEYSKKIKINQVGN